MTEDEIAWILPHESFQLYFHTFVLQPDFNFDSFMSGTFACSLKKFLSGLIKHKKKKNLI